MAKLEPQRKLSSENRGGSCRSSFRRLENTVPCPLPYPGDMEQCLTKTSGRSTSAFGPADYIELIVGSTSPMSILAAEIVCGVSCL